MSVLDRVLPGDAWDASPLARVLPADAPDVVLAQVAGIPVIEGFAHVQVPGARGRDGGGTVQALAGFAGVPGQPVYVSRTDGRLYAANASTYLSSFVVGLVTAGTQTGFQAEAKRGVFTLPDWTAVTGAALLLPGQVYFLSPAGLLTTVLPTKPLAAALVRVGEAVSSTTLDANPSPPILL